MAAKVQLMNDKDMEKLVAEADLVAQEPKLIKVSDKLYIPSNFEEDHNYYADEAGTKRYYGITSVLGVIAKPMLYKWYADMAVDYIKANAKTPWEELRAKDEIKLYEVSETVLDEARVAGFKKRDKAGADGTSVHEQIERLIKASIVATEGKIEPYALNDVMPEQVKEFAQWAIVNDVKFLASEQRLCSTKLHVAGTADFIAEVNGKLMVGDIKTNNSGIYPEHIWQATAYAFMAREMGLYEDFKGVVIVNVPARGGIKVQENYDLKGNFAIFKAALTIFKGKEAQKTNKIKK